jgi:hypothetical protein
VIGLQLSASVSRPSLACKSLCAISIEFFCMKNIKLMLIVTILFNSCSRQKNDDNQIYYIIKHKIDVIEFSGDEHSPPPPPPPRAQYYGNSNFILLDSSIYYFYKKNPIHFCGNGVDYTKPPKINLNPDNLRRINLEELSEFLTLTFAFTDSLTYDKNYYVTISSSTDTIKNFGFVIITDFLKSKNIQRYIIRSWTEEEKFVTQAKIQNKKYNADSVDWKVGFDD